MLEFLDKLDRMERKINRWLPVETKQESRTSQGSDTTENTIADFIKFAQRCYIRSGQKLIPFAPLFEYQIAIALLAEVYPGFAIVKDRQLGITELITCWMLWRSQNPAYAGAVFSITEKDAHKVSARVKRMPSQMMDFGWEIDSVGVRKVQDGGEINFRPSTSNATRGLESIWDLFFDEAGFIPIASEMYAASSPSQEMVGDAARTFIVSTISPDGKDCWFWDQLESGNPDELNTDELLAIARSGGHLNKTKVELPEIPGFIAFEDKSGWCKLIIGHKAHPIYGADPDYVETQRLKKKLTLEQAHREHNLTLPSDRSGNPLINYFDEKKHIQQVEIDPSLPLHVSFDFNRHPATCSLGNAPNDRLIFSEEFYLLHSDTFKLSKTVVDRIVEIDPPRIYLGGDASGKQKTANSQQSNWDIVQAEFKKAGLMFVRSWGEANPPIVDTVNSLNALFMNDRAIVHPRCIELIKDLQKCEDDGKGGINKKADPMRSHLLDTARYMAHRLYPVKGRGLRRAIAAAPLKQL